MELDKSQEHISIMGGGVMGRGLTYLATMSGFTVSLFNRNENTLESSRCYLKKQIEKALKKQKCSEEEALLMMSRVAFTSDFEEALSRASLVIENVPEKMDIKKEVIPRIVSAVNDDCLIATNTSSLSIKELAEVSGAAKRFCGMHFFNPPFVMKLLEVVTHSELTSAALKRVKAFGVALGRDCIEIVDSPGFATSRLSVCIGLEAVRMLEAGVGSAEDIDKAMELGYKHPMGPLKLGDYIGLDVRLKVAEYLYKELKSEVFNPPELLKKMVEEGKTGRKAGEGFYKW